MPHSFIETFSGFPSEKQLLSLRAEMSAVEEIVFVESAAVTTRWALPLGWRDYLILLDHELGMYFGWPVEVKS